MTKRHWYLWIAVVAASFLALEVIGLETGTFTLSKVVWAAADQYGHAFAIICSVVVGFILGHLFFPRGEK